MYLKTLVDKRIYRDSLFTDPKDIVVKLRTTGEDVVIPAGTILELFDEEGTIEELLEEGRYLYFSFPETAHPHLEEILEEAGEIFCDYPDWKREEVEITQIETPERTET